MLPVLATATWARPSCAGRTQSLEDLVLALEAATSSAELVEQLHGAGCREGRPDDLVGRFRAAVDASLEPVDVEAFDSDRAAEWARCRATLEADAPQDACPDERIHGRLLPTYGAVDGSGRSSFTPDGRYHLLTVFGDGRWTSVVLGPTGFSPEALALLEVSEPSRDRRPPGFGLSLLSGVSDDLQGHLGGTLSLTVADDVPWGVEIGGLGPLGASGSWEAFVTAGLLGQGVYGRRGATTGTAVPLGTLRPYRYYFGLMGGVKTGDEGPGVLGAASAAWMFAPGARARLRPTLGYDRGGLEAGLTVALDVFLTPSFY
ncbi:MAG: hypothetical protein H6736_19665 [Alphaproteobacteria bacterium]|nr:hypothetical protein [Alphaproteobacteria bacterium]MCB9694031.1 hypothetical protein [Alphaproteobacteria bacterium]